MWKITYVTRVLQVILWPIIRLSLEVFGNIKIVGAENTRVHDGGAIFASNHASQFDPFLIPATLDLRSAHIPMHYVARECSYYDVKGLARHLYGGLLFKVFGGWPTFPGMKDYERMLPHHIRILRNGYSVWISPEGKLNPTAKLLRGRPGAVYLLWKTGRPIIPVAIHGHWEMEFADFFTRKFTITVTYGDPISWKDLFGKGCEVFSENHSLPQPSHEELIWHTETVMSRIEKLIQTNGSTKPATVVGL